MRKRKSKKTDRWVGGFVARNAGEITDCYSVVKVKTGKNVCSGFAGENRSRIANCFYSGTVRESRKFDGVMSGVGKGKTEQSYYFHNQSAKSLKIRDSKLAVHYTSIKDEYDISRLGYDTVTIWDYTGGDETRENKRSRRKFVPEGFMRFIPVNWLFDASESRLYPLNPTFTPLLDEFDDERSRDSVRAQFVVGVDENEIGLEPIKFNVGSDNKRVDETGFFVVDAEGAIVIKEAKELLELAKQINDGNRTLASSYIRLDNDIDLKGKSWIPIGCELDMAFTGLFDGGGHIVKNFIIKPRKHKVPGFFGYLKGEVYNLTIDCCISGSDGTVLGGIAAYCDKGVIGCCASIASIDCKGAGSFGGLVGSNSGKIFHSYTAGEIRRTFPWLPVAFLAIPALVIPFIIVLLLPILDLPVFNLIHDNPFDSVFNPIPIDAGARREEPSRPSTDSNLVSFKFERVIEVNLSTGTCVFNFLNPGISNHDVVIELRLVGSDGRRELIAKSGAVPSGYSLADLRLLPANERVQIPVGTFEGYVELAFYDMDTHNRSLMESELPVAVKITS